MYIYHALINALSAHMIHINLNIIFYTHVEHSPTKTVYIKYSKNDFVNTHYNIHMHICTHTRTHSRMHTHTRTHARRQARTHAHRHARAHTHTHTHTHNDCSRNWVLISGWKHCEKRKVFSLALNGDRVEQCLRSCGSEFQMWVPKQEKV